MPSTAQLGSSAALLNGAPLSTLCRYRHSVDNADLWIMPTLASLPDQRRVKLSA